jgi:hypothetical protein
MKIADGGSLHVFSPADEKPHAPGPEQNWQESYVLAWYDMKQHVGGTFRLGHEPNLNGGQTQFVIAVASPEGVFHRCASLPLRPQDRLENGFINGDDTLRYEFDGKKIHWVLKDADIEVKLEADLYVPPIDAHRRAGIGNAESILSAHVDAACGVTGTMTIKGNTYRVEALGVRDHAWGTRDLTMMRSHRWAIASFGKEHSFVAMTFLSAEGTLVKFGWVIRNETVIMAEKVSIESIIGEDGGTNFGGTARMTLTTGEVFEAKFEPCYPAIANVIHHSLYYDTMSRVTWGGNVGFGVFETSNNIQGGTLTPTVYAGSIGADGWHPDAKPLLV